MQVRPSNGTRGLAWRRYSQGPAATRSSGVVLLLKLARALGVILDELFSLQSGEEIEARKG